MTKWGAGVTKWGAGGDTGAGPGRVALAGDESQPYRGPPYYARWFVFCRRRGTSPSPRVVFDRATFLGRDNDPDEFETKTVESWVRRSKSWRLRRHFRGACAVAEGYWLRIRAFDLV